MSSRNRDLSCYGSRVDYVYMSVDRKRNFKSLCNKLFPEIYRKSLPRTKVSLLLALYFNYCATCRRKSRFREDSISPGVRNYIFYKLSYIINQLFLSFQWALNKNLWCNRVDRRRGYTIYRIS